MARIELTLTAKSSDLGDEIYNELLEQTSGLEIYPKSDELAIPWDASLYIEGGNVILEGYVAAGGPGSGTSVAKIPLNKVMSVIGLSVYVDDEQAEDDIRTMFDKYGWL